MSSKAKDRKEFLQKLRHDLKENLDLKSLHNHFAYVKRERSMFYPYAGTEIPETTRITSDNATDTIIAVCFGYCEGAKDELAQKESSEDEKMGKKSATKLNRIGSGALSLIKEAFWVCEVNYIAQPPDPKQPKQIKANEIQMLEELIEKGAKWLDYAHTYGEDLPSQKPGGRPAKTHLRNLERALAELLCCAGINSKARIAEYVALFLLDSGLDNLASKESIQSRLSGWELNNPPST